MRRLYVLLIEDHLIQHEKVEFYCRKLGYDFHGIQKQFADTLDIVKRENPDVILQDINLNHSINGILMAKEIMKISSAPIIFTTAHKNSLIIERAAEIAPSGYLIKPFDMHNMQGAIELAIFKSKNGAKKDNKADEEIISKIGESFFIKLSTKIEKVKLEHVLWLESAEEKYVKIITSDKSLPIRTSLEQISNLLPDDRFVRINRNQVANIEHLESIDQFEDTVIIAGKSLFLGPVFKNRLLKKLDIIN
ncbi:MAG: response regulator transcription factor [Cyclobacteriaceae bacterium]